MKSIVLRIAALRRNAILTRQYRHIEKVVAALSPPSKEQMAARVRTYFSMITENDIANPPPIQQALQLDKLWSAWAEAAFAQTKSAYAPIRIRATADWLVLAYCTVTYLTQFSSLQTLRRDIIGLFRQIKRADTVDSTADWFVLDKAG